MTPDTLTTLIDAYVRCALHSRDLQLFRAQHYGADSRPTETETEADARTKAARAAIEAHCAIHVSDYRLSESDLKRIINEAGIGNDLSDAVKDLLNAHYQIQSLTAEVERLKSKLEHP